MRFFDPDDNGRLNRMVSGGALSRDTLEKAVGDHGVSLADALVAHGAKLPAGPWIEFGIRSGLARLNHTAATPAFVRDLNFADEVIEALVAKLIFPFARNAYGQLLVAVIPELPAEPAIMAQMGANPVRCVATLPEMADLRDTYRRSL
jgi:hypothetical protein